MIMLLGKAETIARMNEYGTQKFPFVFLISFDMNHNLVLRPAEISPDLLLCSIGDCFSNSQEVYKAKPLEDFRKYPPAYERYSTAFDYAMLNLRHGNSYLLNLTMPSQIEINCSLRDLYHQCHSRYRIYLNDTFLCFSPETFVRIDNGMISAYPMKGTIDASLPDALNVIMNDSKEIAEHYTIVDLIRNDLSMVASDVRVDKFRYSELISTCQKDLIEISSRISGRLEKGYESSIGDIIFRLLPAGSVTGAPKQSTLDIILGAEQYDRGFYTGVFGYFDGTDLDSAVTIRYIEMQDGKMVFKSGGGITVNSDPKSEYQELIDKIYVPIV